MDTTLTPVPSNDNIDLDEIVDEHLLDFYRQFLEEDGIVEPMLSTILDAIPRGKRREPK